MEPEQLVQVFRKHNVTIQATPLVTLVAQSMKRPDLMTGPAFERSKRIQKHIERLHAELNAELAYLAEQDLQEPVLREHNAIQRAGVDRYRKETEALAEFDVVQRAHWAQHPPKIGRRLQVMTGVTHILKEAGVNYTAALCERIALELLQNSFEHGLTDVTLKQTIVRFLR